jgi:signal transduction histidine kinase
VNFTRSLRGRVLIGVGLWTLGVIALFGAGATYLIGTRPHSIVIVHWPAVHIASALLFTVVLLVAGVVYVRRGVSPITQLRHKLSAVHAGQSRRVQGEFPTEIEPLITDLNALLEHHEVSITRAQAKAGDLAHGLKTPLAVLGKEAADLEAAGHHDHAEFIRQQVDRMRRQIDYHLAHARAAASGASKHARCVVHESVDGLVRTVSRIYADRGLTIDTDITTPSAPHIVRVQREDLDEMLGNLLDNACKWARQRVHVSVTSRNALVQITVDDDGGGVPEGRREDVLSRGVRADQTAPGSGFGLAIVRDLAELYGGTITLDESPLGGARATLTLPSATD